MEIRTEVEIDAPIGAVWNVLVDFARYPEWNPFIVGLEGTPAEGERLTVTLSMPETAKEYRFRPRILRCEPEKELRWLGHLWVKGLFDGEHFFRLEPRGERTRFIHGEDFFGILLRFSGQMFTLTTRGFVYMNQALKQRVEKQMAINDATGSAARGEPSRP
jgi:hypothetical protein